MTEEQRKRYGRHILLAGIGEDGQEKILASRVLVVGLGGLGSPAALYLAAAGVGTIGIADADPVDITNLQRQVIHFTKDIDRPKTESAREKMLALNPGITVNAYRTFLNADTVGDVIKDYEFVIDATDNFATKFLINDACVIANKPFSHAGVLQCSGQTMTVVPGKSACYRCVFPAPPPQGAVPTTAQAGILGPLAGMIGIIQAVEAVKYVANAGELLANRLLTVDALTMEFRTVNVRRNPACPVCGDHPSITAVS